MLISFAVFFFLCNPFLYKSRSTFFFILFVVLVPPLPFVFISMYMLFFLHLLNTPLHFLLVKASTSTFSKQACISPFPFLSLFFSQLFFPPVSYNVPVRSFLPPVLSFPLFLHNSSFLLISDSIHFLLTLFLCPCILSSLFLFLPLSHFLPQSDSLSLSLLRVRIHFLPPSLPLCIYEHLSFSPPSVSCLT